MAPYEKSPASLTFQPIRTGAICAPAAGGRLTAPRISKNQLSGHKNRYEIKLTRPQYRLVYRLDDAKRRPTIIAVASRQDIYAGLYRRQPRQTP